MKKNNLIVIIMLFIISCKDSKDTKVVFNFISEENLYSYSLILGTDTQKVDSLFNAYYNKGIIHSFRMSGNYETYDTITLDFHLRKYYIPVELAQILNNMPNECNLTFNEDSLNHSLGKMYEFRYPNNKSCFLYHVDDANKYFKQLETKVDKLNISDSNTKFILEDLKALLNFETFFISERQKNIIREFGKRENREKEMEGLIKDMEKRDSSKREILKSIST